MSESGRGLPFGQSELAMLAQIGRAIVEAQLDQDRLCELIYSLAGRIVPTTNFQLGLVDGDRYRIRVWIKDGVRQAPAAFTPPAGQGIVAWLRQSREPLLVHDFAAEMDALPFRPTYENDAPPRSAIFLPLLQADTIIGLIAIQSAEPNAFGEDQVRLLTVLANQAAAALNNAELYQHGQRRLNHLAAVAEVGRKINSILDLSRLLSQVVELIQVHFGYYHVQIFLVPHGSDRAYFQASSGHGLNAKWQREGRSLRLGEEGIIGWVAQHGEALLANDVATESRYIPDDPRLLPDTRAELAVPLLVEDEVVGVLDVQSTQTDAFDEEDRFVLDTLAAQVAVAVNSARAYEAQREEAWVTTVMLQVAQATGQADGLREVLDAAVRVTAMLAGVESCTIWLWDEELNGFRYSASFGLAGGAPDDSLGFTAGEWPALDHLRMAKAPAVINLADAALPAALRQMCPGDSLALLPLINKNQVFGVVGVSFRQDQAPDMNERRLAMLGGIAHQVAAAIDNSRLSAAREEEAWVSTVLLQVAEAIGRFQPLDTTLAQVAHITPLLAGVDRCAILLRDDEGCFHARRVHALNGGATNPFDGAVIQAGELPLLDDACRLGQPLMVDDTTGNPRVPAEWQARFGSRTLLVVPLLLADEVIGALLADDAVATHRFSPRRVRIIAGIAGQAAVAIENARLQAQEAANVRLLHELELGHTIQRGLLPQSAPQVPGYSVVYRWRSAREVGGDFFDFMALHSSKLGLLVADVSDKGIPAALYMMFARTLMRTIAFSGRAPAAMLERCNELIVTDSLTDMFITAYYSVLDYQRHILTYASAGHNLAFYVPAGGEAEPMTTPGLVLGIIERVHIGQRSLLLGPGDIVMFYTDGVSEALSPSGEMFGQERLQALLAAHRSEPAEAIADAIEAALAAFTEGSSQSDDVTLVLFKRDT